MGAAQQHGQTRVMVGLGQPSAPSSQDPALVSSLEGFRPPPVADQAMRLGRAAALIEGLGQGQGPLDGGRGLFGEQGQGRIRADTTAVQGDFGGSASGVRAGPVGEHGVRCRQLGVGHLGRRGVDQSPFHNLACGRVADLGFDTTRLRDVAGTCGRQPLSQQRRVLAAQQPACRRLIGCRLIQHGFGRGRAECQNGRKGSRYHDLSDPHS